MNITYKSSDINERDLLKVLELWNNEVGSIFPITEKGFYQNVVNYSDKEVMLAYDGDKLVGFIVLKTFSDDYLCEYKDNLFISLFFVSRKYRRQGIGSLLLDFAEKKRENRNLIIGKDIYNFFPGVPNDFDNITDIWLEKRGFSGKRYTHDLIALKPRHFDIKNKDIIYRCCEDSEKEKLIEFLKKNNWKRWAYEAIDYFKNKSANDEKSYLIGVNSNNEIVSFVKINDYKMDMSPYNVMWQARFERLGGLGPLGVDSLYRKNGIGGDMLSFAIKTLLDKDIKEIMIDWTGLMDVYRKYGFEVWKAYKYMSKEY